MRWKAAIAVVVTGLCAFAGGLLLGQSHQRSAQQLEIVAATPDSDYATVVRVIDGDTVELDDGSHVRYLGMNTPEVGQCNATEATNRNRELVENQRVKLIGEGEDRDRFGRLLRYVFLEDGTFVNAELLWEGYARTLFFGTSQYRQVFAQLQIAASREKVGGWSFCGW